MLCEDKEIVVRNGPKNRTIYPLLSQDYIYGRVIFLLRKVYHCYIVLATIVRQEINNSYIAHR